MRLPAVAIVAAFASGIVLGLHPTVARNARSHILLSSLFLLVAFFVLAGILLLRIGYLFPATVASLLGWVLLGFLGKRYPILKRRIPARTKKATNRKREERRM